MKKQLILPIFSICLFGLLSCMKPISWIYSPAVYFPDANLRDAVALALGKDPDEPITIADMEGLTEFGTPIPGGGVRNLSGLEAAINLRVLRVVESSSLNLTDLNRPKLDIGALTGLVKLKDLDLSGHALSDISVLAGLTNLESLTLHHTSLSDISALAGLTKLRGLGLFDNPISDISVLAGLSKLESLNLGSRWTGDNTIGDISVLAGLTELTSLWLGSNAISDISPLAGLTKLQTLGLPFNAISDISALAGLTELTELQLQYNAISDISPLAGLTKLLSLNSHNNTISDLTPLSGLTALQNLTLDSNTISNISALSGLTNLQGVGLNDNSIADISPLVLNVGLGDGDSVSVNGNPLSHESLTTHLPSLRTNGVMVALVTSCSCCKCPDPFVKHGHRNFTGCVCKYE